MSREINIATSEFNSSSYFIFHSFTTYVFPPIRLPDLMPFSFLTAFITISFKVTHLLILFKYAHTISNLLITAISIFSVLFQILEPVLWQHILKHPTPLLLIRCKTMLHIYHQIMPPFPPSYSYSYSPAWFSPIFQ